MLYLITNRKIIKNDNLCHVIEKAVKGGVDGIILREKDLTYKEIFPIAVKIKDIIGDRKVLFIVNHHLEVASEVAADGFHTSYEAFIKSPPDFKGFIGVSVHTLDEAFESEKNGASYLLASHVFETDCKKGLRSKGIQFIQSIKENVKIPIVALGGINLDNIQQLLPLEISGIAVMSSIMASGNPYLATKAFKNVIKNYYQGFPYSSPKTW